MVVTGRVVAVVVVGAGLVGVGPADEAEPSRNDRAAMTPIASTRTPPMTATQRRPTDPPDRFGGGGPAGGTEAAPAAPGRGNPPRRASSSSSERPWPGPAGARAARVPGRAVVPDVRSIFPNVATVPRNALSKWGVLAAAGPGARYLIMRR